MSRLKKSPASSKFHFSERFWFFLDKMTNTLPYVSGGLLFFIILVICVDLVLRKFFGASVIWSPVASGWALLFAVFLTAPYVLSQKGHITVDVVVSLQKPLKRAYLETVTLIAAGAISAVFVYYIGLDAWKSWQRGTVVGDPPITVSRTYIESVIIFGFLLLIPHCLRQAWEQIQLVRRLKRS